MAKKKIPRRSTSMCAATYWRLKQLVRMQVGVSSSAIIESWVNDKADELGISQPTNAEAHGMLRDESGAPPPVRVEEVVSQYFSF